MVILGLSFFYHDSSATLLKDGEILGAILEGGFSRKNKKIKRESRERDIPPEAERE